MAQLSQQTATLACPNCGHQFTTTVHSIIDVSQDPTAKSRLLAGQLNVATCPRCGMGGPLSTPFLYHDSEKELLLVYTPPSTTTTSDQQQQFIGTMVNRVMNSLPVDKRKGYLFQPRTFLSLDTMFEEILIADGISRQQLESQKHKARLLERFIGATSDDVIQIIAQENEKELDYEFFLLLNNIIEQERARGNETQVDSLQILRDKLLQYSQVSPQQILGEAESITPDELLQQFLKLDDEQQQKAMVAAIRPLLDYAFFQTLTSRIEEAEKTGNDDQAARLLDLRTKLLTWIDALEAEAKKIWERKGKIIKDALESADWRTALDPHWQEIDTIFLTILGSNIKIAQEQGNKQAAATLQQLADLAMIIAREHAPPEIELLNRLLETDSIEERTRILDENQNMVNTDFLGLINQVTQDLVAQGRQQEADTLLPLTEQVTKILGK